MIKKLFTFIFLILTAVLFVVVTIEVIEGLINWNEATQGDLDFMSGFLYFTSSYLIPSTVFTLALMISEPKILGKFSKKIVSLSVIILAAIAIFYVCAPSISGSFEWNENTWANKLVDLTYISACLIIGMFGFTGAKITHPQVQ